MCTKEAVMSKKCAIAWVVGFIILGVGLLPAVAGDSLYGIVTAVKGPQVIVLDYGTGHYNVRIVGIDVPEGRVAKEAQQFLTKLLLGKHARMRLEQRAKNGDMVARLFTDDPVLGIKDVGVELVRIGLARRQEKFDYKYGELAAAEIEAQKARRGLWATAQAQ
jgi:endonuclease YncB( thermonuclease family)